MATITVMDWQRVLLFTDGRFTRILQPGRHRYSSGRTALHAVDVRRRSTAVLGQELLTSDGITLKLPVLAVWAIDDPLAFPVTSSDAEQELYAQIQLAVRDKVAATSFDQVVADRSRISVGLREATTAQTSGLGIELISVTVKDLMLPAELRRAATETLLERENGRTELERSRAEAAPLRALANTGRLLEEHPALLQLRTIKAAGAPGTTIVLNTDPARPVHHS